MMAQSAALLRQRMTELTDLVLETLDLPASTRIHAGTAAGSRGAAGKPSETRPR